MTMDARKQRVLQAIVALYGLEGEPVGSSVLANYFDMAVSSATIACKTRCLRASIVIAPASFLAFVSLALHLPEC